MAIDGRTNEMANIGTVYLIIQLFFAIFNNGLNKYVLVELKSKA